MEKQSCYTLMLSLQQMALRRIAVALYNDTRILSLIAGIKFQPTTCYENIFGENRKHRMFSVWHIAVESKMRKLHLPEPLTKQMIPLLKAVGSELFTWKSIHEEYLDYSLNRQRVCLQKLCWTSAGTVDYKKTAEELMHCDVMGIVDRFQLACLYCLEDYIPALWEERLHENKKSIYNKVITLRVEIPHQQLLLSCILEKQSEIVSITAFLHNSIEKAELCINKAFAEYCFQKLPQKDRELFLVRTAENVIRYRYNNFFYSFDYGRGKLSDVLFYLLALMTHEEQIRIFKKLPCEILGCFLDWPWQDLLTDIADVIFTFLPESRYKDLVCIMSKSIRFSGFYSLNFYQNLFLCSPIEFRKCFVEKEIREGYFFRYFLRNEDTETIKLIFKNVDAADRVRLVSSERGLQLIYDFIDEWHLVEDVLRAARLSKEDKNRLKEDFVVFLKGRGQMKRASEKYRSFFEFMEDTGAKAENKRNSEAEVLTKTKKLCSGKEENSTE